MDFRDIVQEGGCGECLEMMMEGYSRPTGKRKLPNIPDFASDPFFKRQEVS